MTTKAKPDADEIARRLATLSTGKRRALDKLLTNGKDAPILSSRVRRRDTSDPLPVSYSQQRLWFLDQLVPGSVFYNTSVPFRLAMQVDAAILSRSMNEIIRRHEILRPPFAAVDGRPIQIVAPSLSIPLPVHDLSSLPSPLRDARSSQIAADQANLPFDLAKGPLLRASLIRLADSDF